MHPRTTNWLFGLIALAAIGFAVVSYMGQSATPVTTITSALPSPTPTDTSLTSPAPTTTTTGSPVATTSPIASPTPAPNRTFSASQALAQPNEVEAITEGGSLFSVAQAHGIKVSELAKFNNITDVNKVYVGQKIIIPDDATESGYTLLFVVNTARLTKEKQKITSGGTSLYTDAVSSAQADLKGIYGLGADTPWSKTPDPADEKVVTLNTSGNGSTITATVTQNEDGIWIVKKVSIKIGETS